jgi:hypothetical protein
VEGFRERHAPRPMPARPCASDFGTGRPRRAEAQRTLPPEGSVKRVPVFAPVFSSFRVRRRPNVSAAVQQEKGVAEHPPLIHSLSRDCHGRGPSENVLVVWDIGVLLVGAKCAQQGCTRLLRTAPISQQRQMQVGENAGTLGLANVRHHTQKMLAA